MAPVNCCEMVGTMTTPSAGEDDIARVTIRRDATGAPNRESLAECLIGLQLVRSERADSVVRWPWLVFVAGKGQSNSTQ